LENTFAALNKALGISAETEEQIFDRIKNEIRENHT